jgi:hypothetical protein
MKYEGESAPFLCVREQFAYRPEVKTGEAIRKQTNAIDMFKLILVLFFIGKQIATPSDLS